jgi:hypothetical protein
VMTLLLHRSTLRYRLQRIREMSGHDLDDPDTRFNLQLATRALPELVIGDGAVGPRCTSGCRQAWGTAAG